MSAGNYLPSLNEKQIFSEALERNPGADRDAYLAEACAGDTQLLSSVRSLIHEHEAEKLNGSTLGSLSFKQNAETSTELAPGTEVGDFVILNKIGPGGCGVVYKALQKSVSREVALKVIRPGMFSQAVIERFNLEKTTLGLLNHSNIVKVFIAGNYNGQPYYAMEFVDGLHLTEFADKNKLSIVNRLKLFLQVCGAVKDAHEHGVIHRDLKPANILVAEKKEGEPLVKVIDFGVAKLLNENFNREHATQIGQLIGTPAYMSPEQTGDDPSLVNESSDIYALGALLYELLVGKLPLKAEGARPQQVEAIRKVEPEPPSACINENIGASCFQIAEKRGIAPSQLENILKGELDRIVMKCLEKEPQNRYGSVEELKSDIEAYLAVSQAKNNYKKARVIAAVAIALFAILIAILSYASADNRGQDVSTPQTTVQTKTQTPPLPAPVTTSQKTVQTNSQTTPWIPPWSAPATTPQTTPQITPGLVLDKSQPDPQTPEGLLTLLTTETLYEKYSQLLDDHLTTNGTEVWDWLYEQSWFKNKGTGKIKEKRVDGPRKEIVLEYKSVEGVETISVVFLEKNGILEFNDLYLYDLKGDTFNMYLSYLLNEPIKAKAEFLLHNPLKFWRPFSSY